MQITPLLGTTVVPICGVIGKTVMRTTSAIGIGYRHDGSMRFSIKLIYAGSRGRQIRSPGTRKLGLGRIFLLRDDSRRQDFCAVRRPKIIFKMSVSVFTLAV